MQTVADWRSPSGSGVWPLQHFNYDKDSNSEGAWDLPNRAMLTACRIEGRDDSSGGLGDWKIQRSTVGDVLGGFFWDRSSREISGWAFAWPTMTVKGRGTVPAGGVAEPDMLPLVWDGEQKAKADLRWGQLTYEIPLVKGRKQRRYSKFAVGTHAIALTATNENEQKNLLMHADSRTVAPNIRGDGLMGTYLCDLTADGAYDPDRYARYQTAWRVVLPKTSCAAGLIADPERSGKSLNFIAWNLALTGREGAFGRGPIIDNGWGAGGTPTPSGGGHSGADTL